MSNVEFGVPSRPELIGRRLLVFMVYAPTYQFNRLRRRHRRRRHSILAEDSIRVIPFFFLANKFTRFFFIGGLAFLSFFFLKSRTVGVSPTLPRNPLPSAFFATINLPYESRVTYIGE